MQQKGKEVKLFYNDGQYNSWKQDENATKGFAIKYYKGLGTSTSKEFKEYFKEKKFVTFQYDEENSDNSIDKVFNKKRANDRKDWLGQYDGSLYLDTNKPSVKYEEFIDREMIHFSKYDNDRSIPNMMDGLKMSLRKILYSAFKRNLTKEIKVAQFSGYVSEHSGYHHGEASLNGAIVGMAQNFVGSNNINLLRPNGQFGTRLAGGKDSASERYIFTQLETITRKIFIPADDKILDYRNDDGDIVEPVYYAPIIPMILVNGALGIGTGFSTQILCYNPKDIIMTLKQRLTRKEGETLDESWGSNLMPYYRGFTGSIKKMTDGRFLIKGIYKREKGETLHITELPVGYWTDDFKQHLENLMDVKSGKNKKVVIKDYDDMSTDVTVSFKIKFVSGSLDELESQTHEDGNYNGIEKLLKLYSFQSTSNMNLFDADDKLKKYDTTGEIMCAFYWARIQLYSKRRKALIAHMEEILKVLSNKAKYIQENLAGTIDLRRKKQDEITKMLEDKGYDKKDDDYKYLVKMPMDSVTEENVVKLMKEFEENKAHLEKLQKTTKHQMWIEDLDALAKEL